MVSIIHANSCFSLRVLPQVALFCSRSWLAFSCRDSAFVVGLCDYSHPLSAGTFALAVSCALSSLLFGNCVPRVSPHLSSSVSLFRALSTMTLLLLPTLWSVFFGTSFEAPLFAISRFLLALFINCRFFWLRRRRSLSLAVTAF